MFDGFESVVGLVVRIRKTGTARNSPVELDVRDRRNAAERDISRLVLSLGEEPQFLEDDRGILDRAVEGIADQIECLELERNRVENPPGYEDFE